MRQQVQLLNSCRKKAVSQKTTWINTAYLASVCSLNQTPQNIDVNMIQCTWVCYDAFVAERKQIINSGVRGESWMWTLKPEKYKIYIYIYIKIHCKQKNPQSKIKNMEVTWIILYTTQFTCSKGSRMKFTCTSFTTEHCSCHRACA